MTWQNRLKGDPLSWLLELESPGVRYLAYRDLLDVRSGHPDFQESQIAAHKAGPINSILNAMEPSGYWVEPGPGYLPKYKSSVWSITTLAQLGGSIAVDDRIARACTYILDHALTADGQFTTNGVPSGTADCLQGNLCAALVGLGCDDPRLERAFDWMARSVTGDGIAPMEDRQAKVRYYAGKCGPLFACGSNNKLPCAWGAVKVMVALSKWSESRRTPEIDHAIQTGVDFLFSTDPAQAGYPCGWNAKPSRNWWKFGFPVFYVTDLLQLVEALVELGYGNDPRLASALTIITDKQDPQGRWSLEYGYTGKTWVDFGAQKQPNKWVTLRALQVLKKVYHSASDNKSN